MILNGFIYQKIEKFFKYNQFGYKPEDLIEIKQHEQSIDLLFENDVYSITPLDWYLDAKRTRHIREFILIDDTNKIALWKQN